MLPHIKSKAYNFLRYTQKYTGTDNVYLAKGGFWITLGQIVSAASGLLLSIVFANLLPQEVFGTYKYILSVFALLSIPTLASMGTALVQAVGRGYEGSFIPAIKTKVKWGLLGLLGGLFLAGYYYLNDDTTLATAFLIASLFVPIKSTLDIYVHLLNGKKEFKASTKFNITKRIISIGLLITTLFFTNNIFIILAAYFLPRSILDFIFLRIILYKFKLNKKKDPKTIPYGIYLSLLGVILRVADNLDKILLWHFLGAAQLAIYSFAILPVQQISGLISGNILSLSLPKLSARNEQELKKTLPKKVLKSFIIIIPIIVLYIIAAPFAFKIFYPQYLDSTLYSQLFALSVLFVPISLFGNALIAKMKKREIAILRLVGQTFRIIMLLVLAPLYGILGVISALLIAGLFHVALTLFLFKKTRT